MPPIVRPRQSTLPRAEVTHIFLNRHVGSGLERGLKRLEYCTFVGTNFLLKYIYGLKVCFYRSDDMKGSCEVSLGLKFCLKNEMFLD